MTQTLLIHVDAADEPGFRWRWLGEAGVCAGDEAALREAMAAQSPEQVALALPQSLLVCHRVTLPQRRRHRRGVVAFAIEPYLVGSVEDWHQAVLQDGGTGRASVVAVQHDVMRHWCDWLDEAAPDAEHRLIAESWLLGSDAPRCVNLAGRALVFVPPAMGWTVAAAGAPSLLAGIEREYGASAPEVEEAPGMEALLAGVDAEAVARMPSLRRGEYAQRRPGPWRDIAMAACGAVTVVAVALALYVGSIESALRAEIDTLVERDRALHEELFPGEPVRNLASRLRREVDALHGGPAKSADFLVLLARAARSLDGGEGGYQLERVGYRSREGMLRLRVSASSLDSLQALAESLRDDSHGAHLASAGEDGDAFAGTLEVQAR